MIISLIKHFLGAILAGICISIGCTVYLKVGGIIGAILFSFGLLSIVGFRYPLFTGTAGFIRSWKDFGLIWITLSGNILGCLNMSLIIEHTSPELIGKAQEILRIRAGYDFWTALSLSILCGFIMTTVVKLAREDRNYITLILGITVFILCGFLHSIADMFYLSLSGTLIIDYYVVIVLGNFIGCNLYRLAQK